MDTEKPGMRLKRLIRAQWPPVTQAAFARRLGVDPTQLGHWLAGRREPRNGSFWLAAARELGIDPSELTSDKSVMSTNGAVAEEPKEAVA